LPSKIEVSAEKRQGYALDLGLEEENPVFWYRLRRISYSHDLDAHVSAALTQLQQILSHSK
jgi:hypothetical protein